ARGNLALHTVGGAAHGQPPWTNERSAAMRFAAAIATTAMTATCAICFQDIMMGSGLVRERPEHRAPTNAGVNGITYVRPDEKLGVPHRCPKAPSARS